MYIYCIYIYVCIYCIYINIVYIYIYIYIYLYIAKPGQAVCFMFRRSVSRTLSNVRTLSNQGGCLIGGSYFHKNIHLRCLKRF